MFPIIDIPKNRNLFYLPIFFIIEEITNWGMYYIFSYLDPSFLDSSVAQFEDQGRLLTFIVLVLVGPLIETLFFQWGLIELLKKLRFSDHFVILIAALVFGLMHYYNIYYILATIVSGGIFSYYYMALRNQGNWNKIIYVYILHAMANFVSYFSSH